MDKDKIKEVRKETVRFLQKLSKFEAVNYHFNGSEWRFPKESGAVKRASMDLTRALADFRRG